MEGMTAMHLAPLITLSGIALSGVPITSSSTLAEASIRLAMSDCSLSSADQITPTRSEQKPSTPRPLEAGEASSLIFVLFRARREHLLFECHVNVSRHPTAFYPLEAVQNRRSFRTSQARKQCMVRGQAATVFTLLWVFRAQNKLQSLLDTTPPKRVPVLWDGSAPAPSSRSSLLQQSWSANTARARFVGPAASIRITRRKFREEENYALLGASLLGRCVDCRSPWFYWSCRGIGRYRQDTVHHFSRAVPHFACHALCKGNHSTLSPKVAGKGLLGIGGP